MSDLTTDSDDWQRRLSVTLLSLALWCLAADSQAAEVVAGGLEFSAAAGHEACFAAGEIDNCPFQLSIALSTGKLMRAATNSDNIAGMQAAMAEIAAKAMAGKDVTGTVKIRIPSILYGPGSFNNVLIYSSQGRSITPELCRGEFRPGPASSGLTGSVVIGKFTPSVLEGSYHGSLYKPVSKDPQGNIRCTGPVSVNGKFRFSLPAIHDERVELHVSEDDQILAFGTAAWKGGAVGWAEADRQAPAPATPPQSGGPVTAESLGCVCSCEALQNAGTNPMCRGMCQAQGLVCQAEPAEDGEWTVEHTLRELEKLGLPQESLGTLRQALENASPEERKMLVETYRQR